MIDRLDSAPRVRLTNNMAYHLRREVQERAAAAAAIDRSARAMHLDLANRHAERAGREKSLTHLLDCEQVGRIEAISPLTGDPAEALLFQSWVRPQDIAD